MKIIDLSLTLENDIPCDHPALLPKITYENHTETVPLMASLLGKDVTVNDIPQGLGYANESFWATGHSTTHVDAPWHYFPTMNNGEKAWTIDEVPLEWFFGPGVVVNFSDKPDGYVVKVQDFVEAFQKMNYEIKPGDIVFVHTSASTKWGTLEYMSSGCGMGKEATLYLLDKGVRVCGTDAWGWDVPFSYQAKQYAETKDSSIIWQGHRAGVEKAYCHVEKMTNLDKLPSFGFMACCFPIKVKNGSAGWTRAVAIIDD